MSGDMHLSRMWGPDEMDCPCPREPCGYVAQSKIVPGCPEHDLFAMKTMRSGHAAANCGGRA